jgi:Ca2+-binding EF-hand superfamily protein
MKSTPSLLHQLALALLALAFLAAPLPLRAAEKAPDEKLSKTKQKYDADKDGRLDEEELAAAKEGAKAKAKATREENQKKALARYDADRDGKLDEEEMARKKNDEQVEKESRKAERETRKAEKEAQKTSRK